MTAPLTPYYVAIFYAELREIDPAYLALSASLAELATKQPGYLGKHSVREGHCEITTSYWRDEQAIKNWQAQAEHLRAQQKGREDWFSHYEVRIAKVEREYTFKANR